MFSINRIELVAYTRRIQSNWDNCLVMEHTHTHYKILPIKLNAQLKNGQLSNSIKRSITKRSARTLNRSFNYPNEIKSDGIRLLLTMLNFVWLVQLFDNPTHIKLDVRFCSITEHNRTSIVFIGFDWFLVGFCSIRYAGFIPDHTRKTDKTFTVLYLHHQNPNFVLVYTVQLVMKTFISSFHGYTTIPTRYTRVSEYFKLQF